MQIRPSVLDTILSCSILPAVKWLRSYLPAVILAAVFWPLSFARLQLFAVICPQYFDRSQITCSHLTAVILTAVI